MTMLYTYKEIKEALNNKSTLFSLYNNKQVVVGYPIRLTNEITCATACLSFNDNNNSVIVIVYEYKQKLYLVIDLLDGLTLRELNDKTEFLHPPLPWDRGIAIHNTGTELTLVDLSANPSLSSSIKPITLNNGGLEYNFIYTIAHFNSKDKIPELFKMIK